MRFARLRTLPLLLAALSGIAAAPSAPTASPAVPFVEDDYARALSQARERGVPIFVEAWAPW